MLHDNINKGRKIVDEVSKDREVIDTLIEARVKCENSGLDFEKLCNVATTEFYLKHSQQ